MISRPDLAPEAGTLRIAGVCERDLDLLLLEEFTASADFSRWFLQRIGEAPPPDLTLVSAQRSATDSVGESDLLVAFSSGTESTHVLLIENKISAKYQPRQAVRYQKRGRACYEKGACSKYSTVLVAPAAYLADIGDSHRFDSAVSYEELLAWFTVQLGLGARMNHKRALLASAINKATCGYQPVEDATVHDFWRAYWRLALEAAPELEMKEPDPKPSRAGFIYFRPAALPSDVTVVHKLPTGLLDLQFAGRGRSLSEIRAEFGGRLLPGMTITQTSESVAIRQQVPVVDTQRGFLEQADEARKCIDQARALLHWYLQRRDSSVPCSHCGGHHMASRPNMSPAAE